MKHSSQKGSLESKDPMTGISFSFYKSNQYCVTSSQTNFKFRLKYTQQSSANNYFRHERLSSRVRLLGSSEFPHLWGCFPLCQRFRKFRLEFKWKGSFRFLLTGIFGITSGGGPHISVGIFRPKFTVPFLTNRFFALIREFGRRI